MKTGIFRDSAEDYHKELHISSTPLKKMLLSPAHFLEAMTAEPKRKKEWDIGTVCHDVMLEQRTDRFMVIPKDAPKRPTSAQINAKKPSPDSVAAIEWWRTFEETHKGKILIDDELFEALPTMLAAFADSDEAMRVYKDSDIEMSHYAKDPETGLYVKARPDIAGHDILADYKTTGNMATFEKQIFSLGYHIQMGFYALVIQMTSGMKARGFKFIAQEKVAPFGVKVFFLDEYAVNFCVEKARSLLNRAKVSMETNHYPSYDDVAKPVSIPEWVVKDEFNFEEVG